MPRSVLISPRWPLKWPSMCSWMACATDSVPPCRRGSSTARSSSDRVLQERGSLRPNSRLVFGEGIHVLDMHLLRVRVFLARAEPVGRKSGPLRPFRVPDERLLQHLHVDDQVLDSSRVPEAPGDRVAAVLRHEMKLLVRPIACVCQCVVRERQSLRDKVCCLHSVPIPKGLGPSCVWFGHYTCPRRRSARHGRCSRNSRSRTRAATYKAMRNLTHAASWSRIYATPACEPNVTSISRRTACSSLPVRRPTPYGPPPAASAIAFARASVVARRVSRACGSSRGSRSLMYSTHVAKSAGSGSAKSQPESKVLAGSSRCSAAASRRISARSASSTRPSAQATASRRHNRSCGECCGGHARRHHMLQQCLVGDSRRRP